MKLFDSSLNIMSTYQHINDWKKTELTYSWLDYFLLKTRVRDNEQISEHVDINLKDLKLIYKTTGDFTESFLIRNKIIKSDKIMKKTGIGEVQVDGEIQGGGEIQGNGEIQGGGEFQGESKFQGDGEIQGGGEFQEENKFKENGEFDGDDESS